MDSTIRETERAVAAGTLAPGAEAEGRLLKLYLRRDGPLVDDGDTPWWVRCGEYFHRIFTLGASGREQCPCYACARAWMEEHHPEHTSLAHDTAVRSAWAAQIRLAGA